MADPITIIGTAGAVANIVEVLSKTISSLYDLHNQWKDADCTILNLIAQLTAVKSALGKIQEWIDSDLAETHHQLAMDLDLSITCCRMLVGKMDSQVSELHRNADDTLDLGSKIKVVFGNKTNQEVQTMLERQISALNLLLTACNCKSLAEQKVLLEKATSRKVFAQVKDETASLFVHRDSASFFSRCTDNLSKLSMVFEFDRELFVSKVYDRVMRGSLKESLRRQQPDAEWTRRSRNIEKILKEDEKRMCKEHRILVIGGPNSRKQTLIKRIKSRGQPFTVEERSTYKDKVRRKLWQAIESVITLQKETGIALDIQNMDYLNTIRQVIGTSETSGAEIVPLYLAADAIRSFWCSPRFRPLFYETGLEDSIWLFEEIHRIVAPKYIPSESDVLRTDDESIGVKVYKFNTGTLSIHMIDPGIQLVQTGKKWIHQFEDVLSIIFVTNISSYSRGSAHGFDNALVDDLKAFESIVTSQWFLSVPSIILFLNKTDRFEQQLITNPLSDYFPDYAGGNNVNKAAQYILWRFSRANLHNLKLYSYLTDEKDPNNYCSVMTAVQDTILQRNIEFLTFKDSPKSPVRDSINPVE